MAEDFNSVINRVWRGSIDIHVHAAPDPIASRRFDAVELAEAARAAGMRGLIFKSHEYPTVPVAYVLNRVVPDIEVFGAISLDYEVGGLNPAALEASAKMGAKKVWMPTFSADHWSRERAGKPGIRVLHDDGRLINVIDDILSIVQKYDMILGSGHLSTEEQLALVKEARARGVKTVVTHADFWIPAEAQRVMAEMGAFIEHAYIACTTGTSPATIAASIRTHGPGQSILSTDLGQAFNPAPAAGLRMWIAAMLREGFSEREVEAMVKDNPAGLLGIAQWSVEAAFSARIPMSGPALVRRMAWGGGGDSAADTGGSNDRGRQGRGTLGRTRDGAPAALRPARRRLRHGRRAVCLRAPALPGALPPRHPDA